MDDRQHQAIAGTLAAQRNMALDNIALQNGRIAELEQRVGELEAENAELRKKPKKRSV